MCIHYLGQYIILKMIDAPVVSIDLKWYKLKIKYSYWHVGQEVAVITVGVLANSFAFLFFILVCNLSQKYIYCFPKVLCRFIAWFGIATVFDFLLISVVDFAN